MVFQFGSLVGLFALLVLVPLVILYLRRPKALRQSIPSLMFFSEHKGRIRSSFLFRKFVRNILFLIQFLAIALLAFSCSEPSVTTQRFAFLDDTVIVLDTSASMTPVFDRALAQARSSVAAETSIVLAGSPVRTIIESGTADRAYTALSGLSSTDRSADLNGAVLRAITIADNNPSSSRVVIITDRRSQLSGSIVDLVRQKGHAVSLIDVSDPVDRNVGITDAAIGPYKVDLTIRNFDGAPRNVTIAGADRSYIVSLAPRGLRTVSFPIGQGTYEFTIDGSDAFAFDDTLYVSNTARSQLSVLIVTEYEGVLPVERALRAINTTDITITKNRLGTITQPHDLIIMQDFTSQLILPSFYSEARQLVENGAILVIGKNPRAGSVPDSVMPVVVQGQLPGTQPVESQGSGLGESVVFTDAGGPLDTYPRNGSITIATAGVADLITILPIDSGASIFYGYDDLEDTFPNTPYYPIFWSNVVEELIGAESVSRFNVETGSSRALASMLPYTTPDGSTIVSDRIEFERAGFYRVGDFEFAANVLNEDESDPRYVVSAFDDASEGAGTVESDIDLVPIIGILALLLLLFEFFLIKKRGEI